MIFVKQYEPPPFRMDEILRYGGASNVSADIDATIDECIAEVQKCLQYKVCYREFSVTATADRMDLGFTELTSATLTKAWQKCHKVVLFAATLGLEMDRLIAKYSHLSTVKAWWMQAIGAERIETLCDSFCQELKQKKEEKGLFLVPRLSPGYGDIPLVASKMLFEDLEVVVV